MFGLLDKYLLIKKNTTPKSHAVDMFDQRAHVLILIAFKAEF